MDVRETAVWFVTGCSSGFGREIGQLLVTQGVKAVAPQAIFDIALKNDAPRHLLLGAATFETATAKLARMEQNFERWRAVTLGADYATGA
jgi:NADP-dependent 3-hydroxy acid dehydrogenase YdfG